MAWATVPLMRNGIAIVQLEPVDHLLQRSEVDLAETEAVGQRCEVLVTWAARLIGDYELSGIGLTGRKNITAIFRRYAQRRTLANLRYTSGLFLFLCTNTLLDLGQIFGVVLLEEILVIEYFTSRLRQRCNVTGQDFVEILEYLKRVAYLACSKRDANKPPRRFVAPCPDRTHASFSSPRFGHAGICHRWLSTWPPDDL